MIRQLIQNTYDTLDRMVTHLVPQPGGVPAILATSAYDLAGRARGPMSMVLVDL